jgi:hypothetical protein
MRRLRPSPARPGGEEGVTVVIVVLTLLALFGMLVLVVDVGGLLWKRRELVNGSDAAALSAASTCAVKVTRDPRTAEVAADELAIVNVNGLDPTTVTNATVAPDTCHTAKSGWVKVTYSQPTDLFFAPVLGFGQTTPVATKATAIWGPAGSATPVPITIYSNAFNSTCDIENLPIGTECYFWFDNDAFGSSRFGLLDLRPSPSGGWDVPATQQQCPNAGANDLGDWAAGVGTEELDLNWPDPTYVCIIAGTPEQQLWGTLQQRAAEHDIVTFPINRCDLNSPATYGQVNSGGTPVSCSTAPHKYDIIGFVDFELTAVLTRQQEWGGVRGSCSVNNYDVTPGTTYSLFGLVNNADCPSLAQSNATIDETTLRIGGLPPTDPAALYTYDPATKSFTWKPTSPAQRTNIGFDWWIDGQCGPPPANSSAVCIKVKTVEVRVGGGEPNGGSPLGNLRAVRLCDETVSGSCNPIAVP